MELSELQKKGLDIAVQCYRAGEKYSVISLNLSQGKTFLVRFNKKY